ncbi:MAG: hypothetical protein JXA20_03765 [Spirochaetes bacterium]|nr:hypothetical protein [Spirochaetota bacterium]
MRAFWCRRNVGGAAGAACIAALLSLQCAYLHIGGRDNAREGTTVTRDGRSVKVYNSCVIMGAVEGDNLPVLVVAHPLSHKTRSPVDYVILSRPGPFMLYLPEGDYHLFALADYDNDGVFERSEVMGQYGAPDRISVGRNEVKAGIVIRQDAQRGPFPEEIRVRDDSSTITYQPYNGEIAKIYSQRFSAKNASAGWWAPSQFMKAFGANIYLVEKYDPAKIPVLFVHGAEGSPQNWVYFYIRLDRRRYQPWFYYYPSGIHLSLSSSLLHERLSELWRKYRFRSICIAAHSIGGLIVRSMLTRGEYRGDGRFKTLFVSFATPWSGFKSADLSVVVSGNVLPSWIDVASQSVFIKRTMRAPLPKSVKYCMFYGRNDSVSRGGALDERGFRGVEETIGVDCDHTTILSDRGVFDRFNDILRKRLQ